MERSVLIRAGLGAILMGAGLALMLSATRSLADIHEISPEITADEVATASAEMTSAAAEAEADEADDEEPAELGGDD
jgi:hypothetical protein